MSFRQSEFHQHNILPQKPLKLTQRKRKEKMQTLFKLASHIIMAWRWRLNKVCVRYLKITWHVYRHKARTKYNMAARSEWRAGAQSGRSAWGQTGNTPPLLNTTHVVHINTHWVEVRQLWRNFTPLLTATMHKRFTVFNMAATEGAFFYKLTGKTTVFHC